MPDKENTNLRWFSSAKKQTLRENGQISTSKSNSRFNPGFSTKLTTSKKLRYRDKQNLSWPNKLYMIRSLNS
jgi:hypothetical protein